MPIYIFMVPFWEGLWLIGFLGLFCFLAFLDFLPQIMLYFSFFGKGLWVLSRNFHLFGNLNLNVRELEELVILLESLSSHTPSDLPSTRIWCLDSISSFYSKSFIQCLTRTYRPISFPLAKLFGKLRCFSK